MDKTYGFTGSRSITAKMKLAMIQRIRQIPAGSKFYVGGAAGADNFAARVALRWNLNVILVLPFRSDQTDLDGLEEVDQIIQMPPGTDYRARNLAIVNRSDVLLVCARYDEGHEKSRRSGTWMTSRIALKKGKEREHLVGQPK